MQVVYTGQDAPESFTRSIFLAGPSPHEQGLVSWRTEALKVLEQLGYDGVVFNPEFESAREAAYGYDNQVEWEWASIHKSDVVVFWVPREMDKFPAFTTNVEFGFYVPQADTVYGRPDGAPKTRYLDWLYQKATKGIALDSLEDTLQAALDKTTDGVLRVGGERNVPLYIWNTKQFQSWYAAHMSAGNRIDDAKVLFRYGSSGRIFLYVLWVKVWVEAEQRHKKNEIVVSRGDISTVCAYHKGATLEDSKVIMVKEFRTTVSTGDCFVRELPGGSSLKPYEDHLTVASHELEEETGISIAPERFSVVGERQLCATSLTHKSTLFAVEITDEELEIAEKLHADKTMHGDIEDSEQTYVEVYSFKELLETNIDWSMLGMISQVLLMPTVAPVG